MADLDFTITESTIDFNTDAVGLEFTIAESTLDFAIEEQSLQFDIAEQSLNFSVDEVAINFDVVSVGPKGADGADSSQVEKIADVAIGGHRCVITTATGINYANSSDDTHLGLVLGITKAATAQGGTAIIITAGEVIEPSWAFTLGNVYVGDNGLLTQMPPTVGFIQIIGIATSPTSLLVAPKIAIKVN